MSLLFSFRVTMFTNAETINKLYSKLCSCFYINKCNYSEKPATKRTAASVYKTMNVFDRNSKTLQRERAANRDDYQLYEYLREEIGWRMADRVFDIKRTFQNGLDLGCSRGYVSKHLDNLSIKHINLCESSKVLLDKATVGEGITFTKMQGDEETIDFPESTFDIVISNLSLHWVNDLPGVFDRVMKWLKPDGVFMASTLGEGTLQELRQSLQLAESERCGGVSGHVSPFTRIQDIGGLLNSAGYTLQTVDTEDLVIWYPDVWQLMLDVRAAGESNSTLSRPLTLSRDVQFAAAAIYHELYGKEVPGKTSNGIPATYQIINFLGWKPDPSQPQPLQRGTGTVSLKDIGKLNEILKDKKTVELTEEDMK